MIPEGEVRTRAQQNRRVTRHPLGLRPLIGQAACLCQQGAGESGTKQAAALRLGFEFGWNHREVTIKKRNQGRLHTRSKFTTH